MGEAGASGALLIVVATGVSVLVSMAAVLEVEVEVAVGEVAALVGRVVMGGVMALMELEVGVAGVVEVPMAVESGVAVGVAAGEGGVMMVAGEAGDVVVGVFNLLVVAVVEVADGKLGVDAVAMADVGLGLVEREGLEMVAGGEMIEAACC